MANIRKKPAGKTKSYKKIIKVYNCEDVEKYLDKAVDGVKHEIIPMIENLDKRDREQFESARKIITDANSLIVSRQEHTEKIAENVQKDLTNMAIKHDDTITTINNSMQSLHKKFDDHIADETSTFKKISETLQDISEHGTKLARVIDAKLDKIEVNGGIYPLNEALKYIYKQHLDTHAKLDEVVTLLEPMSARKKWLKSTQEVISKSKFLSFLFKTRTGAIIGLFILLLLVNTILTNGFGVNFDLKSILQWAVSLFMGQ